MSSNERRELKNAAREQIRGNIFCYFLAGLVVTIIVGLLSFTFLGSLIVSGPFAAGIAMIQLQIMRKGESDVGTVFKGFNRFGDSFVAGLITVICTALWTLLFFIPGIVAALSYSMAYFILADNPEMTGSQAVAASKKLMKGHKWELFVLLLSFIGWLILVPFTFGLLMIWLKPYMDVTMANFYEKINEGNSVAAIEA